MKGEQRMEQMLRKESELVVGQSSPKPTYQPIFFELGEDEKKEAERLISASLIHFLLSLVCLSLSPTRESV